MSRLTGAELGRARPVKSAMEMRSTTQNHSMVVTRSGRSTKETAKKIKFTEDGDLPENVEVFSVESTKEPEEAPQVSNDSESDSDSDEAPEAESLSTSKQALLEKQKNEAKLQQDLRKQERERRKQRDLQFKQQQEAKKEKIKQLAEAEELPDLLPEEAFESDSEGPTARKHLRAEDLEKEHAEIRKKMKLEKLRMLKEQRKLALKRGPVVVQVQSFNSKKQVPRAEQSILDSKRAWLERASLGRK